MKKTKSHGTPKLCVNVVINYDTEQLVSVSCAKPVLVRVLSFSAEHGATLYEVNSSTEDGTFNKEVEELNTLGLLRTESLKESETTEGCDDG